MSKRSADEYLARSDSSDNEDLDLDFKLHNLPMVALEEDIIFNEEVDAEQVGWTPKLCEESSSKISDYDSDCEDDEVDNDIAVDGTSFDPVTAV
jgi:hypothetical protein